MPRTLSTSRAVRDPVGYSSLQCNSAAPTYGVSTSKLGISGSSPFTVAFWGYLNAGSGTQTFVSFGDGSGTNTGLTIRTSGNAWNLVIPGLGTIPIAAPTIKPNNFYEVFVIYNGPGASIVFGVNGLVINGFSTLTMALVNTQVSVGRDYASANPLSGGVSDLRIWNVALTPTQVTTMHVTRVVPTTNLVRRFLFNEGSGSVASDISSTRDSMTITNPFWSRNFVPYGLPVRQRSTPNQMPACIFYYEADQGVTLDGSSKVSQWDDLSGNGANMTQSTSSIRFGYTASSVNGFPSINTATGSGNVMSATVNYFATQPHALLVVAKSASTQPLTFSGIAALGSSGSGGATSSVGTDNGRKIWFGGAGDGTPAYSEPVTGSTYFLVKSNDTRVTTSFINNINQGSVTQLVTAVISPLKTAALGQYSAGTDSGNWNIVSVAGFTKEPNISEISSAARYYNDKYGIGLSIGERALSTNRSVIA